MERKISTSEIEPALKQTVPIEVPKIFEAEVRKFLDLKLADLENHLFETDRGGITYNPSLTLMSDGSVSYTDDVEIDKLHSGFKPSKRVTMEAKYWKEAKDKKERPQPMSKPLMYFLKSEGLL